MESICSTKVGIKNEGVFYCNFIKTEVVDDYEEMPPDDCYNSQCNLEADGAVQVKIEDPPAYPAREDCSCKDTGDKDSCKTCSVNLAHEAKNIEKCEPLFSELSPYQTDDKSHLQAHIDENIYPFNLCQNKTNRNLKKQILSSDKKSFSCSLCPHITNTKGNLRNHMLSHSADKPFSCNLCPYKTKRMGHLNVHLLTHNGDKPFSCNLCSRKTNTKASLRRHIISHSGEKPFSCNFCSYRTNRKGNLKDHILTHSEEKSLSCNVCPYKTKTKACLRTHVFTHTEDKPFSCNLCSYKSVKKESLKRHILTHKLHSYIA